MTTRSNEAVGGATPASGERPGGPLLPVLKFFSSVPLGITLIVILFIYSWIGSAGLFYPTTWLIFDKPWAHSMPRQWRMFELTEFEWFHTWFFDLVIALIVVNVTVTTLRRIPLTILSAGVWCIHVGIVVLCLGSVVYFGTKVEGDAPVIRRNIVVEMPGANRSVPALLGNQINISAGRDQYNLVVGAIDPVRRISAGSDETAFSVTLDGAGPAGDFNLEIIDGEIGQAFGRIVRVEYGGESTTLPVSIGAVGRIGGADGYQLSISDIQPEWSLMTGPDAGGTAFGVVVSARRASGQTFNRQLLDGYPEFSEDFLPGRGRVVKIEEFGGSSFFDEGITMSLERIEIPVPFRMAMTPSPQSYFWKKDSSALMVRELEPDEDPAKNDWWGYPINHLPRYNDYVGRLDEVWLPESLGLEPTPLKIDVDGDEGPLAGTDGVRVIGYLRYAQLSERVGGGGSRLDPFARVRVSDRSGFTDEAELFALDPGARLSPSGALGFDWIRSASELERYRQGRFNRRLTIETAGVAGETVRTTIDVTPEMLQEEMPFTEIAGTSVAYRITDAFDNLAIPGGSFVSVLAVELRLPDRTISRWVADNPARTVDRDLSDPSGHTMSAADPVVRTNYEPGITAPVMLVAGGGQLGQRLFVYDIPEPGDLREIEVEVGEPIALTEQVTFELASLFQNSYRETRPAIIPPAARNRDADLGRYNQWIQVEVNDGNRVERHWLPFHRYSWRDIREAIPGMGGYRPTRIRLSDGRVLELMFSRERLKMRDPVILDHFDMIAHTGGYSAGVTHTIRDWKSHVRFLTEDGPSDVEVVASNKPASWRGLWFFQSYWDPPRGETDPPRNGLSFTGLGIGNRRGVYIQLLGSCMSVAGMLYAFYIKPIIRRKRRERVYAEVAAAKAESRPAAMPEVEEVTS